MDEIDNTKHSSTGIRLKFCRNSFGHLTSSFYYPTGCFALLSMISYLIKPDVVSYCNISFVICICLPDPTTNFQNKRSDKVEMIFFKPTSGRHFFQKNELTNSTSLLWCLRSTRLCSFFGRNWRHQKDISKLTDHYQTNCEINLALIERYQEEWEWSWPFT